MKPPNTDGRYPHFLRPLAGRDNPNRIVCVDPMGLKHIDASKPGRLTEELVGWAAVCLSRRDVKLGMVWTECGTTAQAFWSGLEQELRHPGCVWILSWQCGRAWSLLELWQRLESRYCRVAGGDHRQIRDPQPIGRGVSPGLLVAEDPPSIAQLRIGACPGSILWIDCRNWGVELPTETPRGGAVAERLAALAMRIDVVNLTSPSVRLAPTVAGSAWRSWRDRPEAAGVHCHVNPPVLALEREGQIGGRAECFFIGEVNERVYRTDYRSAYGSVLADEQLPVRLAGYAAKPNPLDATERALRYSALARVRIETDEPCYPVPRDVDVIYPVGEFTTVLCGPELRDAVCNRRVTRWDEIAWYDLAPVCSDWAKEIYGIRERADSAKDKELSSWAKSLLVCLPGKLGARLRCWETVPCAMPPEPWGEWHQLDREGHLERWRALGGVCQRERIGGYAPDSVPAMSCWICSHARYRLLTAIRAAGWDNVLYVDTDCLMVTEDGLERLTMYSMVHSGRLGDLELRAGPIRVEIRGIKYYLEGNAVTCGQSARGVYTETSDGRGRWYTPPSAEGTRTGSAVGADADLVAWPKAAPYRHGIVEANGRVTPHELHERG